uniref:Putative retinitis pigmentosa gtpase regulator b n=1 Tax=Anopheles darlingi TaxID=43151 RepID=A0A2M4CJ47_ANODA
MAEKPVKPETGRNSANLIATNKDSPFQILNVRSLTGEEEDAELDETTLEEEDAAAKDETVPKTFDQDPQKEASSVDDEALVEKDRADIVAENTEKLKDQHRKSTRISDNTYSTDEEPELVIDMSFEEEESPKKVERTTTNKDVAEFATEQTNKKPSEHSDRISTGSAVPITRSNESEADVEETSGKEATAKLKPKADQVCEDEAGVDDDDDVEFVEETDEVQDEEGGPIKEEEDDMDVMELTAAINTMISIICGLRVACNELLERHHTVHINFADTTDDTKNYDDCLKWVQVYLRGSG